MEYDSGSLNNVIEEIKVELTESKKDFVDRLMNKINEEKAELKEKVDSEYENIVSQGKKRIQEDISDMIEKNKIKNQQKYLKTKKEIFDDFIASLEQRFDKYRARKKYINQIKKQIKILRKKYKKLVVFCNKKDKKLLKRMRNITLKTDDNISLGVIIQNKNKTVRVDLTYDKILRKKKKQITNMLFEEIE